MQWGNLTQCHTQWGSAAHGAQPAWILLLLSHPFAWGVSSLSWCKSSREHSPFHAERGQEVRGLTSAVNTTGLLGLNCRMRLLDVSTLHGLCHPLPYCMTQLRAQGQAIKGIMHSHFLAETHCGSLHIQVTSIPNQQNLKAHQLPILIQLFRSGLHTKRFYEGKYIDRI